MTTPIPETSPATFWTVDINQGQGWRTIAREQVEDALHRVETSPSYDVASPARHVRPMDESRLRALLAVMDDTDEGRPEPDEWDRAADLIDDMRGK